MKIIILIIAVTVLSACDRVRERLRYYSECTAETVDKRATFILQCISNANPKSDEEPEDWLQKCQVIAEETYCESVQYKVIFTNGSITSKTKVTE